jgi:aldose 1-epimerase
MSKFNEKMEIISLINDHGMFVEIINYGARVKSIKFPVKHKPEEMTLTYSSPNDYINDQHYLGATCGRVCNRINNGSFSVNGRIYQAPRNDGENCLHGGDENFSMRYWTIERQTLKSNSVTLNLLSPDKDQGFPGTLKVSVTYQLTSDNRLIIMYLAKTDFSTPVNLTNHAYFNLGESNCLSLKLKMESSAFLESTASNIPTGKIIATEESNCNFREPKFIGDAQKNNEDIIKKHNGFDHCFILDNTNFGQPKAVLTSLSNQIKLSVYTDQPAIQLYSGYFLSGQFKPYEGVCLEAQNYPDADNNKHFPSNILTPEQTYKRQIVYKFDSLV